MKNLWRVLLASVALAACLYLPTTTLAQSGSSTSIGSWANISVLPPCLRTADQAQTAGITCVVDSIRYYTNLLLLVIAIASFVYVLYGAFLYTTAFGDENKIKQAKKTITYALAGIVLATLAWTIVAIVSSILGVSAPS